MNSRDAERYLDIVIPTAFLKFSEAVFADDHEVTWSIGRHRGRLFSDWDDLTLSNLECPWARASDRGWPKHFLIIGEEQNGNALCVNVASENASLVLFDHDIVSGDESGFVDVGRDLSTLHEYLTVKERARVLEQPGYVEFTIARRERPRESVLEPISMAELEAYAANDPEFEVRHYREGMNPFTRQVQRFDAPGYSVWHSPECGDVEVKYLYGRLVIRGEGELLIQKLKDVAAGLGCRLFRDGSLCD